MGLNTNFINFYVNYHKSIISWLVFIFVGSLLFGCVKKTALVNIETDNQLLGAWAVKEIHWITPDTTYTIKNAQPGIFMVTPKRYSIIWTPTTAPRKAFQHLAAPTEKEMIEGFRSIVFNAGSYSLSDSTFNIKAEVAKVPGFEGGLQTFKYQVDEHREKLELKMIDETYPNGNKPEWYGKLETLFILQKID